MKINVKWLKDILPKLPSNHKLCDKLTSTGLEVSDIKRIKSDFILDIDVTPNRPDCLSVYGIARDLSASYKVKPLEPKIVKIPLKKSAGIIKSVNKKISPHYTCLQINNIDNKIFKTWKQKSYYFKKWAYQKFFQLKKKNIKTIAILGLAYKAKTNSIKNSPSLLLINKLKHKYNINIFDPVIK